MSNRVLTWSGWPASNAATRWGCRRSADGLTPREQLGRIGEQTQQLASRHARVFLDSVLPALGEERIYIVTSGADGSG